LRPQAERAAARTSARRRQSGAEIAKRWGVQLQERRWRRTPREAKTEIDEGISRGYIAKRALRTLTEGLRISNVQPPAAHPQPPLPYFPSTSRPYISGRRSAKRSISCLPGTRMIRLRRALAGSISA